MTYCYYMYHLYACLKIHEKPLKIGGFANFEGLKLKDEKVFFTRATLYPRRTIFLMVPLALENTQTKNVQAIIFLA